MDFAWDDAKSEAYFTGRGFDFAYAVQVFLDPGRVIQPDTRRGYGEERFQLMGTIQERVFVVVYTLRGDAIRIISARKANKREVIHYEKSTRNT